MDNRKNSFELFGYDFMVDEQGKPWLIEINCSPAMDYSTNVTKTLVKKVLEDTVKVTVDYEQAKKNQKSNIDTGDFNRIFKGKRVDANTQSPPNLCVFGEKLGNQ